MKQALYVLILACALTGCARQEAPAGIDVNGRGAVIAETSSGRVLFEKNADERFPPASTTKVMTAIVAIESMPLDADIVPGPGVSHIEPTIAGLKPGVAYKLKDLLSAILIKSANDAAFVIAEAVAGSEEKFAERMNAKAKKIGMKDTYFATASGLPTGKKDSQYTTARDLARMMRYAARRHRVILEEMSKKTENISGSDGKRIFLKSHNKSLFRSPDAPWGKTGYTREARRTFVGADPSVRPRIVFSLLKSNSLWTDITRLKDRGLELYEEARRNFFTDLAGWIKGQRQRGREAVSAVYAS